MSLSTRPLEGPFGLEILDFEPGSVDEEDTMQLRELWSRHLVLVFRGLDLTAEGQTALAARFGRVGQVANATPDMSEADRSVMMIANRKVDGREGYLPDGEMWFHFDQAYLEVPIIAGLLYAITVPKSGGNTLFANAAAAYKSLPEALKVRLDGLLAENAYEYSATTRVVSREEEVAACVHPVVIRHPVTGTPSLFISPLMTRRVLGVGEDESKALLEELWPYIESPDHVYEHRWRPGDLVLWDNRSVLHARTDFDPAETRILRRLSLAGEGSPQPHRMPER